MTRRRLAVLLILIGLVIPAGAAAPPLLKRATIEPLPDNAALLTVELAESGTVRVHYDSERPGNIARLETFWHLLIATNRETVHVFRLEDLFPDRIHYMRLDCRANRSMVSPLLTFTYPAVGTNRIRIYPQ